MYEFHSTSKAWIERTENPKALKGPSSKYGYNDKQRKTKTETYSTFCHFVSSYSLLLSNNNTFPIPISPSIMLCKMMTKFKDIREKAVSYNVTLPQLLSNIKPHRLNQINQTANLSCWLCITVSIQCNNIYNKNMIRNYSAAKLKKSIIIKT